MWLALADALRPDALQVIVEPAPVGNAGQSVLHRGLGEHAGLRARRCGARAPGCRRRATQITFVITSIER